MGSPHQFDGVKTLSPRAPSRSRRKSTLDRSVVERRVLFWLAVLVLVVLALWLLSEILLPFVAGLAIAYLLTPLTDRLERLGVNRLAAAFIIIAVVLLALVYLILLVAPIVGTQLTSFIDSVPGYVTTLQTLLGDPSRPWLQKLLGTGFSADKSIGDLVTQGVRLVDGVPSLVVVGRARARFDILACRCDACRCLLLDLRLAPHDPQRR